MTFSGEGDAQRWLVLFASSDGGKSWKADRATPVGKGSGWQATTVAGSELITITSSEGRTKLAIVSKGETGPGLTKAGEIPGASSVDQLSFATTDSGWASAGGKLWLTVDGGATWAEITPQNARRQWAARSDHGRVGRTAEHSQVWRADNTDGYREHSPGV